MNEVSEAYHKTVREKKGVDEDEILVKEIL